MVRVMNMLAMAASVCKMELFYDCPMGNKGSSGSPVAKGP